MRLSGCGVDGCRGGGGGGGAAERIPGGGGGGIEAERGNIGAAVGEARRVLFIISAETALREGSAAGALLLGGTAFGAGGATFTLLGPVLATTADFDRPVAALLAGAVWPWGFGAGVAFVDEALVLAAVGSVFVDEAFVLATAGALDGPFDALEGAFDALALVAEREVRVAIGL